MMRILNKLPQAKQLATLAAMEQTQLVKMLAPSASSSLLQGQRRAFVNPQENVMDDAKTKKAKGKKATEESKQKGETSAMFAEEKKPELKKSDKTGNSFRDVLGLV